MYSYTEKNLNFIQYAKGEIFAVNRTVSKEQCKNLFNNPLNLTFLDFYPKYTYISLSTIIPFFPILGVSMLCTRLENSTNKFENALIRL